MTVMVCFMCVCVCAVVIQTVESQVYCLGGVIVDRVETKRPVGYINSFI